MTPLREIQLLEAHRKGDPDALGELLASYQKRIYSICYRMVTDAELAGDLTQDALIRTIEGLDSYDGRSKLSTWIIRVTMNCCLSYLRKQKIRRHQSLDQAVDREGLGSLLEKLEEQGEPAAAELVEQDELRRILLRALADLDPEARSILVLRDLQGLDYQQIAEVQAVPVGTVKSRLFRARASLRIEAQRQMGSSGGERD